MRRVLHQPKTPGQTRFIDMGTGAAQSYEQRKQQGEQHMARFVGTGIDPRYPKGVAVDIATPEDSYNGSGNASELDLVTKGYVEAADPYQDAGRTPSQIAAAVVRGDTLADPYDAAIAVKEGFVNAQGEATARAYDVVHEDNQETTPAGPITGTIAAFKANEVNGLPEVTGADQVTTDIASVEAQPLSDYDPAPVEGDDSQPVDSDKSDDDDGDDGDDARKASEEETAAKVDSDATAAKTGTRTAARSKATATEAPKS